MPFHIQASVPEFTDLSQEPAHTVELYGDEARKPGSFANNILMARRLSERGVRFVQIYHNNWDHHSNVGNRTPSQCKHVDQPCHAIIQDLKQRGLFEETSSSGAANSAAPSTATAASPTKTTAATTTPAASPCGWPAAASKAASSTAKPTTSATTSSKTSSTSATPTPRILRLLGIDHESFTYRAQGLDFKLTGVEKASVVKAVLA